MEFLIKKCTKCLCEKSTDEFSKRGKDKTKFVSRCKSCELVKSKEYQERYKESNLTNPKTIVSKSCSNCKQTKSGALFYSNKSRKDGLSNVCKICSTKYENDWIKNNKNKNIKRRTDYTRNKRCEDINFKLACRLRTRVGSAIKRNQKTGSAVRDLGCSIDFLKQHLESLFQPGMTWDNYSYRGWHIDHIIPLNSFDLSDPEQFKVACHYTNLQPLWKEQNQRKGDRVISSNLNDIPSKGSKNE